MDKQTLPDLPYDFAALEPVIRAEIMELHYKKHHQTYVNNLNIALDQLAEAEAKSDLPKTIALQSAIRFNGGGHINHSIFWKNLAPIGKGGGEPPTGALFEELKKKYGSLEAFISEMSAKTIAIQGSGWGWLGIHPQKKCLKIVTCANQDPLTIEGFVPLLGIDVWEHAYYLQYKNVRADYVKAIWGIVNWKDVENRYNKVIGG